MDLSLQKSLDLFVKSLAKEGKSSNTIVAYKGDINQLIKFLSKLDNNLEVNQITADHIRGFKKELLKLKYTAKSISRKLNSIKNFFSFLKDENVVQFDPSTDVKHPKYQNNLPRVLEPIEYRALRDVCRNDARATAIVELMLQSGLRIKEIESLNIDLNNSAKIALNRYIKNDRIDTKSKSVFVTKTGRTLLARNIRSLLNRYFKKAGIKNVKVNDLRNTFIAYQLKAGVPIDVVSRIVGHKRISTTEKYIKLTESQQESKGIKLKEL